MANLWHSFINLLGQISFGLGLTVFGFVYITLGLRTISNKRITLSTTIIGVLNGWTKPERVKGKSAQFIGKTFFIFGVFLAIVGILITIGELLK